MKRAEKLKLNLARRQKDWNEMTGKIGWGNSKFEREGAYSKPGSVKKP